MENANQPGFCHHAADFICMLTSKLPCRGTATPWLVAAFCSVRVNASRQFCYWELHAIFRIRQISPSCPRWSSQQKGRRCKTAQWRQSPDQIYHTSTDPISSEDASGAHWHVNGSHWYLIDCRCQWRWHCSRASHSAHQITATFVPRRHCCSLHSWLLCGLHAEVPFLSFASLTFIIECCKKKKKRALARWLLYSRAKSDPMCLVKWQMVSYLPYFWLITIMPFEIFHTELKDEILPNGQGIRRPGETNAFPLNPDAHYVWLFKYLCPFERN